MAVRRREREREREREGNGMEIEIKRGTWRSEITRHPYRANCPDARAEMATNTSKSSLPF